MATRTPSFPGAPTLSFAIQTNPAAQDEETDSGAIQVNGRSVSVDDQTYHFDGVVQRQQRDQHPQVAWESIFGLGAKRLGAVDRPSPINMLVADGFDVCVLNLEPELSATFPVPEGGPSFHQWLVGHIFDACGTLNLSDVSLAISALFVCNERGVDAFDYHLTTDAGKGSVQAIDLRGKREGGIPQSCKRVKLRGQDETDRWLSAAAQYWQGTEVLKERSATVFTIYLTRDTGVSSGARRSTSAMSIVELHNTACWTRKSNALQVSYGIDKFKSVLEFRRYYELLSIGEVPSPRRSVLTTLLEDIIGGNAVALSITYLPEGDFGNEEHRHEHLIALLDMSSALHRTVQYPVSKQYSFVEGLVESIRRRCATRQGGASRALTDAGASEDMGILQERCVELEARLRDLTTEYNGKQQSASHVLKMLEIMKEKYRSVVEAKHSQGVKLVDSEEERARLAAKLLESKIERGRAVEVLEGRIRELASRAAEHAEASRQNTSGSAALVRSSHGVQAHLSGQAVPAQEEAVPDHSPGGASWNRSASSGGTASQAPGDLDAEAGRLRVQLANSKKREQHLRLQLLSSAPSILSQLQDLKLYIRSIPDHREGPTSERLGQVIRECGELVSGMRDTGSMVSPTPSPGDGVGGSAMAPSLRSSCNSGAPSPKAGDIVEHHLAAILRNLDALQQCVPRLEEGSVDVSESIKQLQLSIGKAIVHAESLKRNLPTLTLEDSKRGAPTASLATTTTAGPQTDKLAVALKQRNLIAPEKNEERLQASPVASATRDLEAKYARLVARNAVLEEELASYKDYMKLTVTRYKAQVVELRKAQGHDGAASFSKA